jgi:hypothetical protein
MGVPHRLDQVAQVPVLCGDDGADLLDAPVPGADVVSHGPADRLLVGRWAGVLCHRFRHRPASRGLCVVSAPGCTRTRVRENQGGPTIRGAVGEWAACGRVGGGATVHYDDFDVFTSPLSDFLEEAERAGFGDQVVAVPRGGTHVLPP